MDSVLGQAAIGLPSPAAILEQIAVGIEAECEAGAKDQRNKKECAPTIGEVWIPQSRFCS
jgi:hypothetical protein